MQRVGRQRLAGIAHRDAYAARIAGQGHVDRRGPLAVLRGIGHQVVHRLADARIVEIPVRGALHLQTEGRLGQRGLQQVEFGRYRLAQVAGDAVQRHARAQRALAVVQQAIHQPAQVLAAAEDARGLVRVRRALRGVRQQLGGAHHGRQRAAQVMAQRAQEDVAPRFHRARELQQRFGHRLIDGFVEAHHVVDGIAGQRLVGRPQAQHGGAQGAVLGDHLVHPEAVVGAAAPVAAGRRFRAGGVRGAALRLVALLGGALRRAQVGHDVAQDQWDVVAQALVVQLRAFRRLGDGEVHRIVEDALHVGLDEIR